MKAINIVIPWSFIRVIEEYIYNNFAANIIFQRKIYHFTAGSLAEINKLESLSQSWLQMGIYYAR